MSDDEELSSQVTGSHHGGSDLSPGAAVLSAPREAPSLPTSRTLSIVDVNAMMESRPTTLIGVLGLPGAGKTACLVSAYLLLAKGQFRNFSYLHSETLRAFEEIAIGSRTWSPGEAPAQITAHTTMTDDREAGFLHLRLKHQQKESRHDILIPDLPGEWSKALIDRADYARLEFLNSASVIWLVVDGREFVEVGSVAYARYRTQLLIERLAALLGDSRPCLTLVPTWRDAGQFPLAEYESLKTEGKKFGFEVTLSPVASFSLSEGVSPGEGVAELIETSLVHRSEGPEFWPVEPTVEGTRSVAAFRSVHEQ
ncbi:TRAFAC clade GTPase domain-containing protein [Rhizobium leguminosarum]|uniref:TRAFAC clade GTPase domain-containing protein n=1 Tax=Rhizobium leguminosarum TaxID=384 RepID=UPI001F18806A|nr:hypothetical protein [Rhizobium leguminosarum]UIK20659.1 hypothetical protein LZK79_29340 [Rhizobium leguminosarum]